MKYMVMSVLDRAAGCFGRPVFGATDGAMIRGFQDEINRVDADNVMYRHPMDHDLYKLGVFNDEDGSFDLLERPLKLASGAMMVTKVVDPKQRELPIGGNGAGEARPVISTDALRS